MKLLTEAVYSSFNELGISPFGAMSGLGGPSERIVSDAIRPLRRSAP